MAQFFKGDDIEKQYYNSGKPAFDSTSAQLDAFAAGAYSTGPLGDMIYETDRAPLTTAISQDIFRVAFQQIFAAFAVPGTFESYLTVFRAVFGPDVQVTFTVPGPGKLTIAIIATDLDISNFDARYIVGSSYVFYDMVTQAGDNIVFQTVHGFQSQYDLEQMLFEMVPAPISTTITLSGT